MRRSYSRQLAARDRMPIKAAALAKRPHRGVVPARRMRSVARDEKAGFVPPEDWHEPAESPAGKYKIIVQSPGPGYQHVVTPDEIRERLAELPREMVEPLEVVQLSRMTRKKQRFPCYGMQWGSTLYLYPIETDLTETFANPPRPAQRIEARMYGATWEQTGNRWRLLWTPETIKDFYLNNILIHELGHLLDQRNSSYVDRERYAEWFAVEYGYKPSQRKRLAARAAAKLSGQRS